MVSASTEGCIARDPTVVQADATRWEYKHRVRGISHMPPWRLFLWVKFIEAAAQPPPRSLRLLWIRIRRSGHAIRWYYRMGRCVWIHEIIGFLFCDSYRDGGRTLMTFLGAPQDEEEEASRVALRPQKVALPV